MMSILNPLVHIFRKLLTTNLKCFVYSGSSQVSTSATNVSGKNLSLHIPYHLIDSSMDAILFHKKTLSVMPKFHLQKGVKRVPKPAHRTGYCTEMQYIT